MAIIASCSKRHEEATMGSTHHIGLRAIRAGAVALTLAGTMLAGTGAWAGDATPDPAAQTAQQDSTAQESEPKRDAAAPKTIEVSVTPGRGRPGTKVQVGADGRQCDTNKPIEGRFFDRKQGGRVGRPLTVEHASATGWYGASYTVGEQDAVGLARFVVTCTSSDGQQLIGSASFRVRPVSTQPDSGSGHADDGDSVPVPSRIDTGLGGTADGDGSGSGPGLAWVFLPAGALLLGLVTWLLRSRSQQ
jgi:hypothetical protein